MKFKTPYETMKRVQIEFLLPSKTDVSQKDDADINYIIERYVRTGELPTSPMQYLDCTTVQDFQEAAFTVAECNTAFEQLPSKVRDEFKTVANYLEYIGNPDNVQDCVNRGLINPDSVPVEIVEAIQKANLSGEKFDLQKFANSPLPSETVTTEVQTES